MKSAGTGLRPPFLTADNWHDFAVGFESFLMWNGLGGANKKTLDGDKDERALGALRWYARHYLSHFSSCTTTKDAWTILKTYHCGNDQARVMFLERNFLNLRQQRKESVDAFALRFAKAREHLELARGEGDPVSERQAVRTFLLGLRDDFQSARQYLLMRLDAKSTVSSVARELITLELLLGNKSGGDDDQALVAGHRQGPGRGGDQKGKCHNCGKMGHWAQDCRGPCRCPASSAWSSSPPLLLPSSSSSVMSSRATEETVDLPSRRMSRY